MKRAHELRAYRNPEQFEPVEGIVTLGVDPVTQEIATYQCPERRTEVFIAGSQPMQYCRLHGGQGRRTLLATNVAGWDNSPRRRESEAELVQAGSGSRRPMRRVRGPLSERPPAPREEESPKQKKGLFGRLLDVFR